MIIAKNPEKAQQVNKDMQDNRGSKMSDDEINRSEAMRALKDGDWVSEDDLASSYGVENPEELMIQMESEGIVERMYDDNDKYQEFPKYRLVQEKPLSDKVIKLLLELEQQEKILNEGLEI